jgi:hypothetical protein
MTSAILVEHHSKTNAGTFITAVTKLVQPLAFTGHSILRLNRQGAKHAGNNYCHSDEYRLVHDLPPLPEIALRKGYPRAMNSSRRIGHPQYADNLSLS